MSKKTVEVPTVEDRIAKRQEIENRIKEVSSQLGHLMNLPQLGIASAEAASKAKSYLQYHGNGNEASIPDAKKGEYARLKQDAEEKRNRYLPAKAKDESLQTELAELKAELKNTSRQAAAEDVLRHQAKVADLEFQISEFKRVIALEEEKIAQSNIDTNHLLSLHHKRSDLMADRALGKTIDQTCLDELDAQISEKDSKIKMAKDASAQAQIVIAGLKRKILGSEQVLAPMKSDLQTIYCDYLIAEAEKTGGEFAELAAKLWEKHLRLLALSSMVEKQPDAKGITIAMGHCLKFKIPAFNLESCRAADNQSSWLLGTDTGYPDITDAVGSTKRDIVASGIACL